MTRRRAVSRLTNATCSDGAYETYTYDSSGNRLTKTTQHGTISYTYDGDNRLIKIGTATGNTALFYDRSGNLTRKLAATKTISYGYDYENRLVSYADGANTVAFTYDGDGNRVAKTVNGVTTKYVNDTSSPISQVLLETDSQSNVTARYIYGDSRLSQVNSGGASYYIYDNPGRSVVAVVNGAQSVLNSYVYNAFGDIKTINEITPNDFLYTGEQLDNETGLIYLRKRYYDPETGRFLSKDAFPGYVTQPQTVNPYPYVQNNPVNFIDPTGLAAGTISYGGNIMPYSSGTNGQITIPPIRSGVIDGYNAALQEIAYQVGIGLNFILGGFVAESTGNVALGGATYSSLNYLLDISTGKDASIPTPHWLFDDIVNPSKSGGAQCK